MAFTPDYEAIIGRPVKAITHPLAEGDTFGALSAGGGGFIGTWAEGWLLFTNAQRDILLTTATDRAAFDALPGGKTGKSVTVRNLIDNELYEVSRSSCGAGCYCGAKSKRVAV